MPGGYIGTPGEPMAQKRVDEDMIGTFYVEK